MNVNQIYNEDCLVTMNKMPDQFVDLTVTSPPYDEMRNYKGYKFEFCKTAKELYRITKKGGVLVWIVADSTSNGNESGSSFQQALIFKELGFNLHDTMIWHKPNCFNFGSNLAYRSSFEYMFVFSKGKIKTVNLLKDVETKTEGIIVKGARKHANGNRDKVPDFKVGKYKKRDNVWNVSVAQKNHGHPAIFPEQIANDHIISWSNEDDLVYDPFMGSGTTAKMAILNRRNFIGSEISKDYCDIAEKRIEDIVSDK